MKRFEIFFGIIKVPLDFIMTVLGFLAAYQLRLITESLEGFAKPIDYTVLPSPFEYFQFSLWTAFTLIIVFTIGRMYTLKTTFRFSSEIAKTFGLWLVWAMLIITYFFFTRSFPFSRLATLYSWTLTLTFIILGRAIVRIIQNALLKNGIGKRKLLFIGNNAITAEIFAHLEKLPSYQIIGVIGNEQRKSPLKVLGSLNQLEYIIKQRKPDEIIQTISNPNQDENILEICDLNHVNYRFIPDIMDVRRTNIETATIGNFPIISLKPTPLDGWGKVSKRIFDIFGSTLGMIILSPIFLITAIAIKFDSKGPIFFTKLDDGSKVRRVGQHGKLFPFYKFRSMKPNTDSLRYKMKDKNLRQDGPLVKIEDDPRITKVGQFIRKYSIDELPQLWSVFKGDLSLVGPRPHLPEEVAEYSRHHRFVFTIKPGITGLAQISGRSDLDFEEEARLDRYYIENWSLLTDLKIIFKTIGVVLKGYRE